MIQCNVQMCVFCQKKQAWVPLNHCNQHCAYYDGLRSEGSQIAVNCVLNGRVENGQFVEEKATRIHLEDYPESDT
jgi:hypothetical protein